MVLAVDPMTTFRMSRRLALMPLLAFGLSACASGPAPLRINTSHVSQNQDSRAQFLVLHYTVGNFQSSLNMLTKASGRPVSSHYLGDQAEIERSLLSAADLADTPEDMLDALSDGVRPHLPISVLLLGMGADMHTASLFPGADRLAEALAADAPILLPMRAEAAGEPRVTLTAPVLRGAMNIHILITGTEKRDALERALTLTPEEAPVRAVLDNATVHWAE